jgi:hypothetical protein
MLHRPGSVSSHGKSPLSGQPAIATGHTHACQSPTSDLKTALILIRI